MKRPSFDQYVSKHDQINEDNANEAWYDPRTWFGGGKQGERMPDATGTGGTSGIGAGKVSRKPTDQGPGGASANLPSNKQKLIADVKPKVVDWIGFNLDKAFKDAVTAMSDWQAFAKKFGVKDRTQLAMMHDLMTKSKSFRATLQQSRDALKKQIADFVARKNYFNDSTESENPTRTMSNKLPAKPAAKPKAVVSTPPATPPAPDRTPRGPKESPLLSKAGQGMRA